MTAEQKELRAERIAIMLTEKVPQDQIELVLRQYPELYGAKETINE